MEICNRLLTKSLFNFLFSVLLLFKMYLTNFPMVFYETHLIRIDINSGFKGRQYKIIINAKFYQVINSITKYATKFKKCNPFFNNTLDNYGVKGANLQPVRVPMIPLSCK